MKNGRPINNAHNETLLMGQPVISVQNCLLILFHKLAG